VALAMTLGALVGLTAGYAGGWLDALLMRTVDAAMAIPRLFVVLLVVAAMDRVPFSGLILLLGTTGWFGTSRLVRGEVLRVREQEFVGAARALGAGTGRVIFRHLLPNSLGPLLVATTLAVGDVILLEAGLSFLGYGVQPPTPSWGGLILDARPYLATAPWLSVFPGVAIVVTVLAVNLVGEALRDSFDVRGAAFQRGTRPT
jgi:peptide/nickel transport system permease protein